MCTRKIIERKTLTSIIFSLVLKEMEIDFSECSVSMFIHYFRTKNWIYASDYKRWFQVCIIVTTFRCYKKNYEVGSTILDLYYLICTHKKDFDVISWNLGDVISCHFMKKLSCRYYFCRFVLYLFFSEQWQDFCIIHFLFSSNWWIVFFFIFIFPS